jgi:hypothetical protein
MWDANKRFVLLYQRETEVCYLSVCAILGSPLTRQTFSPSSHLECPITLLGVQPAFYLSKHYGLSVEKTSHATLPFLEPLVSK